MADMGYLPIGSEVVISFSADDHNGDTVLRTSFKPEAGQDHSIKIPPGLRDAITLNNLPATEKLHIHVDLPAFGSGVLTVTVDGVVKDTEPIESDTNWDYLLAHAGAPELLATDEED